MTFTLPNGVKMEFIWIPPGEFLMGSPPEEKDREEQEVQHRVRITQGFYMGKCEVTNAQYRACHPSHDSGNYEGWSLNDDNQPAVLVSRVEAVAYCEWLIRNNPGWRFRLPTEAEWEYACRAGTSTRRYWGDDLNEDQACVYANGADQSGQERWSNWKKVFPCKDGYPVTAPVGSLQPNAFGLYDMLGNVAEWCLDWEGPYDKSDQVAPVFRQSSLTCVVRGGGWTSNAGGIRAAHRGGGDPYSTADDLGFRVAVVRTL